MTTSNLVCIDAGRKTNVVDIRTQQAAVDEHHSDVLTNAELKAVREDLDAYVPGALSVCRKIVLVGWCAAFLFCIWMAWRAASAA